MLDVFINKTGLQLHQTPVSSERNQNEEFAEIFNNPIDTWNMNDLDSIKTQIKNRNKQLGELTNSVNSLAK